MAGTDFTIHSSLRARANSQAVPNRGMSVPIMVAMLDVDGDTADLQTLAQYHTLVHEDDTAGTGIIVRSIKGVYTEAVTHASGAGVITVRTKGTSPAELGTLTFADNEPVGDTVDSSIANDWCEHTSAGSVTTYCVPAGYGIEVALTTAGYETTADGDGAGRMMVIVEYMVIPKRITQNQT